MQNEKPVKDPEGSAVMFGWFLLAAIIYVLFWLASSRLHLTGTELFELGLLTALGVFLVVDVANYFRTLSARRAAVWPPPKPYIRFGEEADEVDGASDRSSVLLGHESDGKPVFWDNETRSWQTITSGMSGSGKTTLIESILQQDINRGVPIIFVDGKGEKKLLDRILPIIEAAGRMDDFRLIDPSQPEVSVGFNPLFAPQGCPDEYAEAVFESFKVEGGDDFFDQHQRVYLLNIVRILFYSGKRFNFYDVLVAAYDDKILVRQIKIALDTARADKSVTRQQILTLEMSIQNLLATFQDKDRVSKIQGLINHLMTYMSDSLSLITGPYEDLLTIEDVLEKSLILYVSLNINVNADAVMSLGRILLQNLQLTLGQRYASTGHGVNHDFVSVLLDEFAPFAYQNFSRILQTARGGNVAFMFALQTYGQLDPIGFGLKDSLSSGPNNSFMLRMKDYNTSTQFRRESGEVKQERLSVHVEKSGILNGDKYEEQGTGSKSDSYELLIRDEQLKCLPNGQMQILMSDKVNGMVHKHVHVREPFGHFIAESTNNLFPSMAGLMAESCGLNLRFPTLELESKRTDYSGKKTARSGRK
jgi:GTPase SAR1 family protein